MVARRVLVAKFKARTFGLRDHGQFWKYVLQRLGELHGAEYDLSPCIDLNVVSYVAF